MRHISAAVLLVATLVSGRAEGQTWNDPASRSLIARAIERRRTAEADSTLVSYRATGRGVVTFLAEVGSAGSEPARLLKGDELAVEVYWQRPDRSKQIIRGWRDSTFFPTDINYHRDHLGIVTDDFGPVIRIGDGDEVGDVPHPLSPGADTRYDYSIRDTTIINSSIGRLTLIAVDVRPKDRGVPGVIGSLFLDADRSVLVRSHFTFTAASYRDNDLEDITIRLERSLVDGRYWLPFRQEIEIRRRAALVEFPLRGVIRGRWNIDDYEINAAIPPAHLAGPSIGGLSRPSGPGPWTVPLSRVVDSSLAPVDRSAIESVRREALRLARGRVLDGLPGTRLLIDSVSQLARVNRVQGLSLGSAIGFRPAGPFDRFVLGGGVGTADGRVSVRALVERRVGLATFRVGFSRAVTDFSDLPVSSGIVGSIAAQEGGRDYGDYVLLERLSLGFERRAGASSAVRLDLAREWASSVETSARPARGSYRPNPALGSGGHWIGRVSLSRATETTGGSSRVRIDLETGSGASEYARLFAAGEGTRPVWGAELSIRGLLGLATAGTPARRSFVTGGRSTLPGEPFRAYGGRRMAWLGADWLFKIPAPGIPLGWLGSTPKEARLGPLVALGWAGGHVGGVPWQPSNGARPVVGIAAELFARTIRIELGQALRGNRGPGVTIDVSRRWWPVL